MILILLINVDFNNLNKLTNCNFNNKIVNILDKNNIKNCKNKKKCIKIICHKLKMKF